VTSEGKGLNVRRKMKGHEILGSTHKIFKPGIVFYGGNDKQIGLQEGAHFKFGTI
jgi:hypothetical protein